MGQDVAGHAGFAWGLDGFAAAAGHKVSQSLRTVVVVGHERHTCS